MEQLNHQVRQWSQQSAAMMRKKVRTLTNSNKHKYLKALKGARLAQSIRYKNLQRFGTVERVVFPFEKHGFFLAVGASKGHHYKTNPRKKVGWYNFVFDERMDELADIVMKHYGDEAMLRTGKLNP